MRPPAASGLVPAAFAAHIRTYPPDDVAPDPGWAISGAAWLRGLPALLEHLIEEWELEVDGTSAYGQCAVATPVKGASGPAMLNVSWPHHEAVAEHLALRRWDRKGAVRLLRADPRRFALLLERADPLTDLTGVPVDDACAVIGDLLARLRAPALPKTPRLSEYADRQARALVAAPALLPRRVLDQSRALLKELTESPDVDAWLLHTDLHYVNVLAAERQPWLAIDPKPVAGDRAFEIAPSLWNRAAELGTGSALRHRLRRRLQIICERAGIDEDRARAWTIVREVDNALGAAEPSSDRVSLAIAIIKAMNG